MPSSLHETLVLLFRTAPEVVAELLKATRTTRLPAFTSARIASIDRTEAGPATHLADVVVELERDGVTQAAVIVEVQLARDRRKPFTWPLYVASVHAELECDTYLVICTVDERVAAWARREIRLGHPRFALSPIVIGPRAVPVVTDPAVTERYPELGVLSALAHGGTPIEYAVARAAIHGTRDLDEDLAALYITLILNALSDAGRAKLEEAMRLGKDLEPTDLEKRILARGEAKGRAEGEAEGRAEGEARGRAEGEARGRAEAILAVLSARDLEVGVDVRDRVLAERDPETLSRWLVAAVKVERAEDVFDAEG